MIRHPWTIVNRQAAMELYLRARLEEMQKRGLDVYRNVSALNCTFEKLMSYIERYCSRLLSTPFYDLDMAYGVSLYVICRWLKPLSVVETGIGYGISSAMILTALHHNNIGRLYSIDIGGAWYVDEIKGRVVSAKGPGVSKIGSVVPPSLRDRWQIIVGRSRDVLPQILRKLGSIDVFIHDSQHTYTNMLFEFRCAYEHLGPSGVLICDDSDYTTALEDFVTETGRKKWEGISIKKNKDGHEFSILRLIA